MVSCFFTAPSARAPFFPSFQAAGKNRWASNPPSIRSARACLSFPISPEARDGYFSGDVGRRKKWTKATRTGGGLGEVGPYPFSEPRSTSLPSPAWHLSRPDNGTSPGGACAVPPGPSAGGGVGAPGRGDAGRPGGSRGA